MSKPKKAKRIPPFILQVNMVCRELDFYYEQTCRLQERLARSLIDQTCAALKGTAVRVCVHCGCTDSRACMGGCTWMIKHQATNTGVCSQCVPKEIKLVDAL